MKSILKILKCSNIYPIVLVEYFKLCWAYKQIGSTSTILEQNAFICRGLIVPVTTTSIGIPWLILVTSLGVNKGINDRAKLVRVL